MTDFTAKSITDILLTSAEVKRLTAKQCAGAAMQAAEMIAASLREGGKLMLSGNGGSAADRSILPPNLSRRSIIAACVLACRHWR